MTAVAGRRGSIWTPIRDALRAIGRPGAGGAFYRIRLSFDQRRAGAQPGVATVQIRPLRHPAAQVLDISENRSKSVRVRAICDHVWTQRAAAAA